MNELLHTEKVYVDELRSIVEVGKSVRISLRGLDMFPVATKALITAFP